eukprot:2254174-Pleurochrysis_carterae.AAC.1
MEIRADVEWLQLALGQVPNIGRSASAGSMLPEAFCAHLAGIIDNPAYFASMLHGWSETSRDWA